MAIITIKSCLVCGSDDLKKVFDAVDHFSSGETFAICDCTHCEFRFTNNFSSEDIIGRYYDSPDYISHSDSNKGVIYCSLVKATKQILDKVELENKTFAKITPKERIETRLWDMIALREAIINSIVHNDYTREVPPKIEFFDDRIKITSYGGLPEDLSEEDFFEGVSMPRNKEVMRIFKDLELVEQLGSGVPRILQSYGKECFRFLDNFIRMTFPSSQVVTPQVTPQVGELVKVLDKEMNRQEMQDKLNLSDREHFRLNHLKPALDLELVEMTIPDKPNSSLQKYRLTVLGKQLRSKL